MRDGAPPRRRRTAWHVALLIALPVLVHAPELLGLVSSDPNTLFFGLSDPVRQWTQGGLIPGMPGWIDGCAGVIVEALGRLVARDWLHGIIPWWNPYNGVGMPLAGEYQPAAFFLPFVLLTALPNGLLWMKLSLQIVAGLSTRGLLRAMGLRPAVALAGGLVWAFNGSFAWASDGPSEPLAFLPMALMGIERLRARGGASEDGRKDGRGGGWGWLGLGSAWMLLAGFPETTYLLGLLVIGWAMLRIGQETGRRTRLVTGIALGGVTALLLAAPQLLAFLSYLPDAFIGAHSGANDTALPRAGWIMLLFPYLNGPIFYGSATVWWSMGGFYGVLLVWLALLSLFLPGERGLRLLLGAVVAAVTCKQAALPGITALLDLLPGMRNIFFFRYAPPLAAFALLVLAALALDHLLSIEADPIRRRAIRRPAMVAALAVLAAVLIGWQLDRTLRMALLSVSDGPLGTTAYQAVSLLFGLGLLAAGLFLLTRPSGRRAAHALLVLVVLEPLLLFCVPLLSTMQPSRPDTPLLHALRAQIGQDRMVTIGPLPPNVNAAYGLRAINHNGVPMPAAWIRRLRQDFGPDVDTLSFNGFSPFDAEGKPFLADALLHSRDRFEALGVGLVLTPHGFPLAGRGQEGVSTQGAGGEALIPGVEWNIEATHFPAMSADRAFLLVGTYAGRSDGTLLVRACPDGASCVDGVGSVSATPDNGAMAIRFSRPFVVRAGIPVRFTFRLQDAHGPLMIWLRAAPWGPAPALALDDSTLMPRLVFSGPTGDLYRLPSPAPYAEAAGCRVSWSTLETVRTECARPAKLIRRELMMRGWRARVNGVFVTPTTQDELFQSVPVPAGPAIVRFSFAPPGAVLALIGSCLGAVLLIAGFRGGRRHPARS
ncbi:hypothetical protein NFI95_00180 [Acetobacteraceae bacterium KSS8]|uniref:YfhO family protein n=1 Tax=Endosaccharibacter trunci TaxID=2812733 RepID=A0ABT1W1X0_9PROT|nr:hypothetical protein [Acetobacteraceae bacterium KSS8]